MLGSAKKLIQSLITEQQIQKIYPKWSLEETQTFQMEMNLLKETNETKNGFLSFEMSDINLIDLKEGQIAVTSKNDITSMQYLEQHHELPHEELQTETFGKRKGRRR